MNSKIHAILVIILCVLILLPLSCVNEPKDGNNSINPNIIKIKDCCTGLLGNYLMGQKTIGNIIYALNRAFVKIEIDSEYNLINAEFLEYVPRGDGKPINYFHLNHSHSNALIVKSPFTDVSLGELAEVDLVSETYNVLKDSTYNISSAVYWHGDDNRLIYYSYGNDEGLVAGYYLYDKTTGEDSLLYAHQSPMGPSEMLNGFDLSPDNRKLLIPDVRASWEAIRTPQIIEYDLHTEQADTFDVAFDLSFVRIGLWLRYSPDGNRILYSNFPLGSFTETTNDDSEVGIIELPSRQRYVLDVNTYDRGLRKSVQLAPTWSPDGNHIIYGSAPVIFPSGAKGRYSLYILKNVDDPRNYQ